jgi:formylglycine-generating enzyme required for sulfatase activity
VTYELWYTVHAWATGNGYTFDNAGREGNDGTDGAEPTGADQEPVTAVSWRDSIVWCNALTEWYNAKEGTSYECVYTYSGSIIRDSTNATACDGADESTTAKGFRLLSSNEYECAARYRGTITTNVVTGTIDGVDFDAMATKWTKGNSASGATTYYNDNTGGSGEPGKSANDAVAVYRYYWDGSSWVERPEYSGSTESVAGLTANTLGLYDMSGNVREWCFTESGDDRVNRGGSWDDHADYLQVGGWVDYIPDYAVDYLGFRPCRTAD